MFRTGGGGGVSSVITVTGPPGPVGPQGAPGQSYGNALISGGAVLYVPSTLQFVVSAATYIINNTVYSSPETTVTLTAADGSNPRVDVIVLTSSSTATSVDGTAAASPAEPTIDPLTQLRLTAVTVNTGATSIGVTTTTIYDEDNDWTASVSGAGMNKASLTNPHAGTKTVEATAATNGQYVNFANGSAFDTTTRNFLTFYIRSKATWPGGKSLQIRWYNSSTAVGVAVPLSHGAYNFNSSNTSAYQLIGIPLSAFGVAGLTTTDLRFTVTGGGAAIGFYLDDIVMQGGVMVITPTDAMRDRGAYSAAVQYQVNDVVTYNSSLYICLATTLGNAPTTAYWAARALINPMTAGGDIIYGGASGVPTRLANGSSGQVLTSAGGTSAPTWSAGGALPVCTANHSTTQSINSATETAVNFDTELLDTDAFHSTVTNNSRFTIPTGLAGWYSISVSAAFSAHATGRRFISGRVNGNTYPVGTNGIGISATAAGSCSLSVTFCDISLAEGDYFEATVYQDSGAQLSIGAAAPSQAQTAITFRRVRAA